MPRNIRIKILVDSGIFDYRIEEPLAVPHKRLCCELIFLEEKALNVVFKKSDPVLFDHSFFCLAIDCAITLLVMRKFDCNALDVVDTQYENKILFCNFQLLDSVNVDSQAKSAIAEKKENLLAELSKVEYILRQTNLPIDVKKFWGSTETSFVYRNWIKDFYWVKYNACPSYIIISNPHKTGCGLFGNYQIGRRCRAPRKTVIVPVEKKGSRLTNSRETHETPVGGIRVAPSCCCVM